MAFKKEIVEIMGLQKEYFTVEEFAKTVKVPRSNCILSVEKLQKVFPMTDIKTALKQAVKKYNEI